MVRANVFTNAINDAKLKHLPPKAVPAFPSILSDHAMANNETFYEDPHSEGNATAEYGSYYYEDAISSGSNDSTVNEEQQQQHLSIFNVHLNPMLDVCTVEVPVGDSLPRDIHLFGLSATTTTTEPPTTSSIDLSTDLPMDFPVFHSLHVRHRRPNRLAEQELVERPPETQPEEDEKEEDFVELQKLEEIDFGLTSTTESSQLTSAHPLLQHHHRQRQQQQQVWHRRHRRPSRVSFSPVASRRVVMTRGELASALESMLAGREEEAAAERRFLDALLQDEDEEE